MDFLGVINDRFVLLTWEHFYTSIKAFEFDFHIRLISVINNVVLDQDIQ